MPQVYSLTHLTGARRNEDRRTVIFAMEVRRYTVFVVSASVIASLVPTALLLVLVGPLALFVPAACIVAGIVLWDTRQRNGMKLRTYQAILDKRKAKNGVLYASGSPIQTPQLIMHQMVVVPARMETAQARVSLTKSHGRRGAAHAKELLSA
jgi:membrane glycosyltransferase